MFKETPLPRFLQDLWTGLGPALASRGYFQAWREHQTCLPRWRFCGHAGTLKDSQGLRFIAVGKVPLRCMKGKVVC